MGNYELNFDAQPVLAGVTREGDLFRVTIDGKQLDLHRISPGLFRCEINGRRASVAVVQRQGTWYVDIDSIQFELTEPSADGVAGSAADQHAGEKDKIFAPMPGRIVKIMVSVGDEVQVKQPIVIVEAMKMENQVNSRANGKVRAIHFKAGDQVDTERPILELDVTE